MRRTVDDAAASAYGESVVRDASAARLRRRAITASSRSARDRPSHRRGMSTGAVAHRGVRLRRRVGEATSALLPPRDRRGAAALRPRGRCQGRARDPLDPVANRTYHYWHAFVPGVKPGQLYGYRVDGPFDPRARLAVRPDQGAARPVRPRRRRAEGLHRDAAAAAGRQRRDRDEERGRGSVRLRLGRRRAAAPAVGARTSSTRCTSAGSRGTPTPASTRSDARHLRRADREDPVPAGPRRHRGRAAAGLPVRRPGLPARAGQLLGLPARVVLRAAPGVQLAPRPARPGGRVPRHGEGAAPRRHRGDSRRGVQPHRRGQPRRADALLPRDRQPDLLHPRRRTARATPTTPAAATRSTPTTRSSAG